jgi:hypothetical protein
MRNAVTVVLVAVVALAAGFYVGRGTLASSATIPTNGTHAVLSPDGTTLTIWNLKEGRPTEVRSFSVWQDLPADWTPKPPATTPRLKETVYRPGPEPEATK